MFWFRCRLRSSCRGDLAQISGVTDHMGNVEENLVKLEGQLFGRLDGNKHQSRSRLHDGRNSSLIVFRSKIEDACLV